MKNNLYVISVRNAQGQMFRYGIVAATRQLAEDKANELAGIPKGTEAHTSQTLYEAIDAVI